MELIVAVYDDWGIGCEGTQPVALSADRKFFRETTRGSAVILGRRTLEDFPGKKPLPGRVNIVLTHSSELPQGFVAAPDLARAAQAAEGKRTFVIGGGSVYAQMLPLCDKAWVTKVHTQVACDTFFPNLDEDPDWELQEIVRSGEENGIAYEMTLYCRR